MTARLPLVLPVALSLCLVVAGPASAQVALSGQIRPRFEIRNPSGADQVTEGFTSMRTRLAATFRTKGGATAFIQLQDVRLFGEEANTLSDFSADGLDAHQAWLLLGKEGTGNSLKVGRQEVDFGGQRLVGSVGWTQQGRSFDGARIGLGAGKRLRVDLLAAQLQESVAPARATDASFLAAYATVNPGGAQSLDLYGMTQQERVVGGDTDQWTLGARHVGTAGSLSYRFEGSLQTGTRQGKDVSAYMAAGRVGSKVGGGSLTLWYDHLSGTKPGSGEVGAFETLFATNHKFYGYADLFLNIPVHTGGRGLQDLAIKASAPLVPGWTLGADAHRFLVVQDAGLASAHLADEIDLTLSHRLPSGVALTGGFSYVIEGDALGPVRGIRDNVVFGYLMLDLVF